ncbi:hypothetical protein PybrP1_009706 [[Pythium] brassicae (nom. inval.)]|nr:hypothetical protein PybrP1_009706 [[Pythium] brassicae (nom. inval.)]
MSSWCGCVYRSVRSRASDVQVLVARLARDVPRHVEWLRELAQREILLRELLFLRDVQREVRVLVFLLQVLSRRLLVVLLRVVVSRKVVVDNLFVHERVLLVEALVGVAVGARALKRLQSRGVKVCLLPGACGFLRRLDVLLDTVRARGLEKQVVPRKRPAALHARHVRKQQVDCVRRLREGLEPELHAAVRDDHARWHTRRHLHREPTLLQNAVHLVHEAAHARAEGNVLDRDRRALLRRRREHRPILLPATHHHAEDLERASQRSLAPVLGLELHERLVRRLVVGRDHLRLLARRLELFHLTAGLLLPTLLALVTSKLSVQVCQVVEVLVADMAVRHRILRAATHWLREEHEALDRPDQFERFAQVFLRHTVREVPVEHRAVRQPRLTQAHAAILVQRLDLRPPSKELVRVTKLHTADR